MTKCYPATGSCELPDQNQPDDAPVPATHTARAGTAVHYVGDPMCSWCWGIAPVVSEVEAYCKTEGIAFSVTTGGLRAGGGEPWNAAFKDFLRGEWQRIAGTTGQPFGFSLLDAAHFDYDTEPACRAVVAARLLPSRNQLPSTIALAFFSAVQHKFYVGGQDPKVADFYASICADLALDFDAFRAVFGSAEARQAAQQDFDRCRQWGVSSFPTLLLEHNGKTGLLAAGYATAEQVLSRLRQAVGA